MLLPFLAFSLSTASSTPPPPSNDACPSAIALTCGVEIPGSLDDAIVEASNVNIDGRAHARPDVFYAFTLPPGTWRVGVRVRGLAGTSILNPALDVARVSPGTPCSPPMEPLAKVVFNTAGSSDGDSNANGRLNLDELLELCITCLPAGEYRIELHAKPPAPTAGAGAFEILLTCAECAPPAASIGSANGSGAPADSFPVGAPIYATGSLANDCFTAVRLVANPIVPGDQMPLAPRVPDSATWIRAGTLTPLVGTALLETNEEIEDLPGDEQRILYESPALVDASASTTGSLGLYLDIDQDGIYDAGLDAFDSTPPTVHPGPGTGVPTMSEIQLMIFAGLIALLGAGFMLRRKRLATP